jgi:hypothetical protein
VYLRDIDLAATLAAAQQKQVNKENDRDNQDLIETLSDTAEALK